MNRPGCSEFLTNILIAQIFLPFAKMEQLNNGAKTTKKSLHRNDILLTGYLVI